MPTSSVGKAANSARAGVTLIEMLIVVAIIGIMASITYPAVSAGIDSMRINGAATSIVTFLNLGLNRADRRQHPVEVTILPAQRLLRLAAPGAGVFRELQLADGIAILGILPAVPGVVENEPRQFLVHPGGTVPQIGIVLGNLRGHRRVVSVDPISGVPRIERPSEAP